MLAHKLNYPLSNTEHNRRTEFPTPSGSKQIPGAIRFVKACDRNINKTIALANDMIELADRGDADREDVGCGILYGILRDSAFKLKRLAETEKRKHHLKAQALEERSKDRGADTCPPAFRLK